MSDQKALYHRSFLPPVLPGRKILAVRWNSPQISAVAMMEKPDQDFEEYATPWEEKWSNLFHRGTFLPAVDAGLTVVGHVGKVGGGHFTHLIVPRDAVPSRAISRRSDRFDVYYSNDLGDLLARGIHPLRA